ncbi:MAG: ATP-binding protein, partial [Anaerolineales bacterium]
AEDKGLALYFDWSDDVPRHVLAEEGKLRQILSNLLGNAVKFTQQGEVTLRVKCATHSKQMARLHFEVEDTGPGIAPQDLAVVFDPFVQSSIDQRFQEGTGLGLSISRQYVNLMGGDLTVRSELGQGSLFQFDLLVELAGDAELEAESQHHRVIGLEADQPEHRLLIAEDNESNRQLLVKLLEPLGFAIREAVNGQDAVQIWEQWEPELIWMDMRMPIMDGHQATMHIKGTAKGQDTVIIALTATAFEEERERVLFEGCEDFVRKPFREEEIFDMLVKYLDVRFIYEEPVQPPVPKIIQKDVQPSTDLVDIPSNLMADLQEATITADMSQIIKSIEQISLYNPTVAERLTDFAHNYEYKKILDLIDNSGEDE